jgi:hypothetical protein
VSTVILVLLFRVFVAGVKAMVRDRHAVKTKPLCEECACAHIQFGACGRRTISCTYGGGVRVIKLDVLYCTDYRPRMVPVRPTIGFVREIAAAK